MKSSIPAPRGVRYVSTVELRPPVKHPRLTAEEFIAAHRGEQEREEKNKGAAGGEQVKLLDAGMKDWLARARVKWIAGGGFGFRLTAADVAEMRAAGVEPAPEDPWYAEREKHWPQSGTDPVVVAAAPATPPASACVAAIPTSARPELPDPTEALEAPWFEDVSPASQSSSTASQYPRTARSAPSVKMPGAPATAAGAGSPPPRRQSPPRPPSAACPAPASPAPPAGAEFDPPGEAGPGEKTGPRGAAERAAARPAARTLPPREDSSSPGSGIGAGGKRSLRPTEGATATSARPTRTKAKPPTPR